MSTSSLNLLLFMVQLTVFNGPESDNWLPLSVTHSLTHSCFIDLFDMTLACEDANSKLAEVEVQA